MPRVLVDHPFAILLLFFGGQAAAWYYLRSGRIWIGLAASVSLWVLADWYCVAKYLYGLSGRDLVLPLVLLQAVAAATVVVLLTGLWRRRWSATARQRPQLFGQGLAAYLRGELDLARRTFRRLVRSDPWDAAAWVALGNVETRRHRPGPARRCYRRGRSVDRTGQFADFVAERLRPGPGARPAPAARTAVDAPDAR